MTISANDPKWTAYVLGELPVAERDAVERELAQSPEARKLVDEIQQTVRLLSVGLAAERGPGLTSQQRARIVAQGAGHASHRAAEENGKATIALRPRSAGRRVLLATAAVAATVLVAVFVVGGPFQQAPRRRLATNNYRHLVDHAAVEGVRGRERDVIDEQYPAQAKEELSYQLEQSGQRQQEAQPLGSPAPINALRGPSTRSNAPVPPASRTPQQRAGSPTTEARTPDSRNLALTPAKPPYENILAKPVYETKKRDIAYTVNNGVADFQGNAPEAAQNAETPTYQTLTRPSPSVPGLGRRREEDNERLSQLATIELKDAGLARSDRVGRYYFSETETARPQSGFNTEGYDHIEENRFLGARDNPLSTFSIDVDTASYSNIRRFLMTSQQWPAKGAVRIEEMINYFTYEYPQPDGDVPFSATVEVAGCPWNASHRLVRVGLKGKEVDRQHRPLSNLVFLLDVSGSMNQPNKLPLVKQSMRLLTEQLQENDRVAIVVYAGNSGLVLPGTSAMDKRPILEAIDRLEAGGSTNGGEGIELAYKTAHENFIKGGTNRVILATDGDFNVGITDRTSLIDLVTKNAAKGVFLTTIGFGMGNLKDGTLEQLADKGNGNYAYIDDMKEAKKLFVEQLSGTLVTIAKDVKIQIEFNPAAVESYRLIGYENRALRSEDFNDDKKDAGEIGAGHTVTALYELVPAGKSEQRPPVDPLKYQRPTAEAAGPKDELLTLKLRYKQPDGDTSKLLEHAVKDSGTAWAKASPDYKFAASVALFGMILRGSEHKGTATLDSVLELGREGMASDQGGYRSEFIQLVEQAKKLGNPQSAEVAVPQTEYKTAPAPK